MQMFKNIKNFIRQGRQARDYQDQASPSSKNSNNTFTTTITSTPTPPTTTTTTVTTTTTTTFHTKANQEPTNNNNPNTTTTTTTNQTAQNSKNVYNFHELASQLVNEEKKAQPPKYPGLEAYSFCDKLGEGAFSTVHKAVDLRTNEPVAIKVIKKQQLDNNQRKAVTKEVAIMGQLNNENIVKFIEFKEVENYYYIVQEIVEGGEIFNEIVKFTYFSEDLARHVIKQVGEAIKYLHEEIGVVHRDIKPENLLFHSIPMVRSTVKKLRKSDDPNKLDEGEFRNGIGGGGIGIVKLADFGLSKRIGTNGTKTPCGTVGYTAPEIVQDLQYSKEVDMWALGCVLYTLLCGFPPFYDERVDQLTEKVAKGEYQFLRPWWDEISADAKHCVKKLLTVNPLERYTINDFLRDPWLNRVEFKKPQKVAFSEGYRRSQVCFSPAARALKDAFDITNEIHRVGEENLYKKRNHNLLYSGIMEEEEEDQADSNGNGNGERSNKTIDAAYRNRLFAEQQQQRLLNETDKHNNNNKTFELKLDTSTILNRRKMQMQC